MEIHRKRFCFGRNKTCIHVGYQNALNQSVNKYFFMVNWGNML